MTETSARNGILIRRRRLLSALAPNRNLALGQYRARAGVYDLELAMLEPVRRRSVDRLHLKRGQVVFDIACGTGLSFPLLRERVGRDGRIIGIEQSPEMLAQAQSRVAQRGWKNVTLLNAPVEEAEIPCAGDAAFLHFTHDVLRTPEAVANVMCHLRPGARVVAAGLKWAPLWAMQVNLAVWQAALRSVTSLEGLREPWNHLTPYVSGLEVESLLGGGVFIARGIRSAAD